MTALIVLISAVMIIGAVAVIFQKSVKNAILLFGIVSLSSAVMYVFLKAYDVAITEAAIGSVLTTAYFFLALKRLKEEGYDEHSKTK